MKNKSVTNTIIEMTVFSDKHQNVVVNISDKNIVVLDEKGNELPITTMKVKKTRPRASSYKKGDKTISECIVDTATLSVNRTVYENFDVVYAIDTNTKQNSDSWFSVGALVKLIKFEEEEKDTFTYEIKPIQYITSANKQHKANMEQWVWLKVIELIREHEPADKKIGLVVDSDMNNVDKYNNKEKKICDREFLPENITLLYASADNKNYNILTIMIAKADKFASEYLKEVCKH